jgi:DNA-directed RNA polymerase subunit M/transcription elongation factor TFIIS
MSTIVYGLLLSAKGDVKKLKLLDTKTSATLNEAALQDSIKKKTKLSELGQYPFGSLTLTLFGYTTGKAGTENKHELPPPLDTTLYFGDILVVASSKSATWKTPISITVEQYEKWYQNAFDGFEDLDEEDDEDDEDEEEEEEEEEEPVKQTTKKKAAEEDGVPEDEVVEDAAEEDEEADEEEEEEDEEEDEEEVQEEQTEDIEEAAPKQAKQAKKKKPSKQSYASGTPAVSRQQELLKTPGFKEIDTVLPLDKTDGQEKKTRTHILTCIQSQFGRLFKKADQYQLESVILKSALKDATAKSVLKHFTNPLFEVVYMAAARRLIGNLNTKCYVGNQHLLQKVLQGALDIDTLADMTAMDYAPTIYAPLRERMMLREQHQLEGNKAMATDLFKCGRCHKKECTYYELQTRSADEPMTKFITCLNCGNHWRM